MTPAAKQHPTQRLHSITERISNLKIQIEEKQDQIYILESELKKEQTEII